MQAKYLFIVIGPDEADGKQDSESAAWDALPQLRDALQTALGGSCEIRLLRRESGPAFSISAPWFWTGIADNQVEAQVLDSAVLQGLVALLISPMLSSSKAARGLLEIPGLACWQAKQDCWLLTEESLLSAMAAGGAGISLLGCEKLGKSPDTSCWASYWTSESVWQHLAAPCCLRGATIQQLSSCLEVLPLPQNRVLANPVLRALVLSYSCAGGEFHWLKQESSAITDKYSPQSIRPLLESYFALMGLLLQGQALASLDSELADTALSLSGEFAVLQALHSRIRQSFACLSLAQRWQIQHEVQNAVKNANGSALWPEYWLYQWNALDLHKLWGDLLSDEAEQRKRTPWWRYLLRLPLYLLPYSWVRKLQRL